MRLKTRFFLLFWISSVVLVTLSGATVLTHKRLKAVSEHEDLIQQAAAEIFALDLNTLDLVIRRDPDSVNRWQAAHRAAAPIFAKLSSSETPGPEKLVTRLYASLPDDLVPLIAAFERGGWDAAGVSRGEHRLADLFFDRTRKIYGELQKFNLETDQRRSRASREHTLMVLASMAATFVIVWVNLIFFVRRFSRPLDHLSHDAQVIGSGDLDHRVAIKGNDEISNLARTIDQMRRQLKLYYATLEDEVRRKTRELADALENAERQNRELGDTRSKLEEERRTLVERQKELEKARLELERSNRDLEQFAYSASHDLQEPLRMVSSYTQLLARRYEGRLDPSADEFIQFAVDGTKRMKRMINDLLEYSRLGSKGSETAPVDLNAVLGEVMENLQVLVEEAGAVVRIYGLPVVYGDRTQFGRLFQNLISNAVKFRGEGAAPFVKVGAEKKDAHWQFWVQDNGIGIPEEALERVFLIFQRVCDREKYPGTGIGLAVCRKIVERHGGRIWVQSKPGEGSTFYFTIPEAPRP